MSPRPRPLPPTDLPSFDLLTNILHENLGVERSKIRPDSRLIDFGIDSVRAMELVIDLERNLEIPIPDQDLADLRSIQELADYLDRRIRE